MIRRLAPLALALLLPWAAVAQTGIELVVDCSASMGERLGDGRTRLNAVQEAMASVIVALPADDPKLAVGLRVNGAEVPWSEPGACEDTTLAVPVAAVDRHALLAALLAARPGGTDPIAAALTAAAEDFPNDGGRRVLVFATDGNSGLCSGDYEAAAEALEDEEVEVRVVGRDLGAASVPLAGVMRVLPAASTADLLAGMRRALDGVVRLAERSQPVTLRVLRGRAEVEVEPTQMVDAEGTVVQLRVLDGALHAKAPPGVYDVRLIEPSGATWMVVGLPLWAGTTDAIVFELPPQAMSVEVLAEPPRAGGEASVRFSGAPAEQGWVTVVPVDAPVGERGHWVGVEGPDGEAHVGTPDTAAAREVRYLAQLSSGASLLLNCGGLASQAPTARLTVASEVEIGGALDVGWSGSVEPGDCVLVAASGVPDFPAPGTWTTVTASLPLPLVVPSRAGDYEVRYLSGRTARVLARAPVTVIQPRPRLVFPAEVRAGAVFEVEWSWTLMPGPDDYLGVARVGAPAGEYLTFAPVAAGSPTHLEAPAKPSDYEVRFTRGQDQKTLAALLFKVVEVEAEVRAPGSAMVGTRLPVEWRGPDRSGDFVAIAQVGAAEGSFLDWAYTSVGSPLTLAAPEQPGEYEVRYVSAGHTLASARVKVRPPS